DPTFRRQRPRGVDGAVLGPEALVLRFFGAGGGDRLLLVNLGTDLAYGPRPQPPLAPPPPHGPPAPRGLGWSGGAARRGGGGGGGGAGDPARGAVADTRAQRGGAGPGRSQG